MPLASISKWHFDIDAWLNPYVPPPPWRHLPRPVARFLGVRPPHFSSPGNVVMIAWAFIGVFCSLSIIEVTAHHVKAFQDRGAPLVIGSFGAAAVLEFYAIESPLSQPRNALLGQVLSSVVGVAVGKLFALDPAIFPASPGGGGGPVDRDLTWLAGALACACATALMAATGTVHPPAGATALLAVASPDVRGLGWWLVPAVALGVALMLATALLVNNVQRRFPVYWWSAGDDVGSYWRRGRDGGGGADGVADDHRRHHHRREKDLESGNRSGPEDDSTLHPERSRGSGPDEFEEPQEPRRRIIIAADGLRVPDDVYLRPEERAFLEELCGRV